MKRYYVAPCIEIDTVSGKHVRTWDVMERAFRDGALRNDEATAVSNHDTRATARIVCAVENLNWRASRS